MQHWTVSPTVSNYCFEDPVDHNPVTQLHLQRSVYWLLTSYILFIGLTVSNNLSNLTASENCAHRGSRSEAMPKKCSSHLILFGLTFFERLNSRSRYLTPNLSTAHKILPSYLPIKRRQRCAKSVGLRISSGLNGHVSW